MNNLRDTIATKILGAIPPRVKPIDYLMETLNISRESVYRRIRGDISFTFEEIAKLSVELGFSIDELIMKDTPSHVFFDLHIDESQAPSDTFVTMFEQYFQCIYDMPFSKDNESVMVLNQIPCEFIIFFEHLFKFFYYRWMHQYQESSLKYFYSDVILPDKLQYLQQKAIDNFSKVRNNTFIFDSDIFLNLIKEIQYYFKRRLINETEFMLLKDDLVKLIDMVESIAQTGFYISETKFNIYLSVLNISSSSRYLKSEDQTNSQFFVGVLEPLTVASTVLCSLHKKWIDSIRKYSTLITQSNEILQIRYFNKQRAYIEGISDISSSFSL